jgi:hypothetical protein
MPFNADKLKKLQQKGSASRTGGACSVRRKKKTKLQQKGSASRTGGTGSVRRKKKTVRRSATHDDKRLKSTLNILNVRDIPSIEEDDSIVTNFATPQGDEYSHFVTHKGDEYYQFVTPKGDGYWYLYKQRQQNQTENFQNAEKKDKTHQEPKLSYDDKLNDLRRLIGMMENVTSPFPTISTDDSGTQPLPSLHKALSRCLFDREPHVGDKLRQVSYKAMRDYQEIVCSLIDIKLTVCPGPCATKLGHSIELAYQQKPQMERWCSLLMQVAANRRIALQVIHKEKFFAGGITDADFGAFLEYMCTRTSSRQLGGLCGSTYVDLKDLRNGFFMEQSLCSENVVVYWEYDTNATQNVLFDALAIL